MYKRFIDLIVILPLLVFSGVAFTATSSSQLHATINKIFKSTDNNLNTGIIIENPANGKILYQDNQNRLFTPASNMKLFTAYSALKVLGPNLLFKLPFMQIPRG